MKKTTVLFTMLMALVFTAQAQDTIHGYYPKPNYLYQQWPDFEHAGQLSQGVWVNIHPKVRGILFNPEGDTLTVYGMAVNAESLPMWIDTVPFYDPVGDSTYYAPDSSNFYRTLAMMCDTSAYEEAYECFGIYKRVADSLQRVSTQLPVNVKLDTPTYWHDLGIYEDGAHTKPYPPMPIYELYFHQPYELTSPFYIGVTNRNYERDNDCKTTFYTWPLVTRVLAPTGVPTIYQDIAYYEEEVPGVRPAFWVFTSSIVRFCFPILTPPDSTYVWDTTAVGEGADVQGDSVIVSDTVIVGGDTIVTHDTLSIHDFVVGTDSVLVGDSLLVVTDTIVIGGDTIVVSDTLLSVMQPDLLQRLTGVMPSPARDRARVVSSVGLTGVEVYSLTGRRVHTLRLTGSPLSATLDVSRWPAGTYLLRITTPMGTTMKKLTVTR